MEEKLLRLGGIAGLLAAVSLVLSFAVTAALFLSLDLPADADTADVLPVLREHGTILGLIVALIVAGALLAFVLFLALEERLRRTTFGRSGASLGAVAAIVHAVGAVEVRVTQSQVAALYSEASADEKNTVVQLTDAVGAVAEGLWTVASTVFLAAGFLAIGLAIFEGEDFSRRFGWFTVILGALLTLSLLRPDPHLLEIFLIIWLIPMGLKIYRLSRRLAN